MDLFIPKILHMRLVRAGLKLAFPLPGNIWTYQRSQSCQADGCHLVPQLLALCVQPFRRLCWPVACLPNGQILSEGALVLSDQRQTSVTALSEQLGSNCYWMGPTYNEAVALVKLTCKHISLYVYVYKRCPEKR